MAPVSVLVPGIVRSNNERTVLIGSVSLLVQDGSGSVRRVSTPLFGPFEVLRQSVRPLVVRRWNS
jgi:hypothetical protein